MVLEKRPIERIVDRIIEEVASWEGIQTGPHRFGGTEFLIGHLEMGHIHRMGLVDIPFIKPIREQIIMEGLALPHHVLPESGWISFYVRTEQDFRQAIRLYQMAYLHTLISLVRRGAGPEIATNAAVESLLNTIEMSSDMRFQFAKRLGHLGANIPGEQ